MGQDALLNLTAFALQVCVIAGTATLLLTTLRIASASARYLCWRIVLAACLAMPFMLQRPAAREALAAPLVVSGGALLESGHTATATARIDAMPALPQTPTLPWSALAASIIGIGAAARAVWLVIGLWRLRALRRRGVAVDDEEYADVQNTLGTRAMLLSVEGLKQPATFGLWRSVVLLPDTLAESPATLRRAVVTHELFHVQRRDWLWVLAEEALKTALWFHPAIAWLISRIQLAREELVDELTVLAIGNRKAYIEALLAFADAGRIRPAPAFARRRQLFTRILRLSKESVMSSPRIVASAAAVVAVVLASGWYGSSAFPIVAASSPESAASTPGSGSPLPGLPRYQVDRLLSYAAGVTGAVTASPPSELSPPRSLPVPAERRAAQGARSGGAPRPGAASAQSPAQNVTGGKPVTPENPIPRRLYSVPVTYPAELQGSGYGAAVEIRIVVDANGVPNALSNRASFALSKPSAEWLASRIGPSNGARPSTVDAASAQLQAMLAEEQSARSAFMSAVNQSISQWRYDAPVEAPLEFSVAVLFGPDASGVVSQSADPRGVSAIGGAVALGTGFAADPAGRVSNAGLAELDRRQLELQKVRDALAQQLQPQHPDLVRIDRQLAEVAAARARLAADLAQRDRERAQSTGQPVRVGGNIRPPVKTKHVNPEYPEIAKTSRVQGVVILEATIDEQGRVAAARILRSIPLLDQAALDAVRQWEFTPTLLNGSPVAIIMTMTVQFVLPPQ